MICHLLKELVLDPVHEKFVSLRKLFIANEIETERW